jgi:redox-sensing transcriptional repressor
MVSAGVTGLWNFANMELSVDDPNVTVENIHLGDSLLTLCFDVKLKKDKKLAEKEGDK